MADTLNQPSRFWRGAFTTSDNTTGDLGRIMWAITHLAAFVLQGVSIFHGSAFDPVAFGTAHGGIALAFGGNLRLKNNTEPSQGGA